MASGSVTINEPISPPKTHYLNCERGLWSWLTTVDHKRIGLMYLIGIAISFGLGGFFALLIRWELSVEGSSTVPWQSWFFKLLFARNGAVEVDPLKAYNQVMTLHGAIMVFLVIIPSIPAALGNFFLPMQLGAKDVAFPKLNLASFYVWVIGALIAVYSIIVNSVDTGWTFYTPYSSSAEVGSDTSVIPMTFGAFIMGFSSILTGLNFIVTCHKLRAPGMSWFRMPLFVWSLYATSVIQLLATPVLGITLVLLIIERSMGIGIFDPALGGDPILYQHFFWFYSHPAVYIMILPAMGVISELITCFSRKKIFGYKPIVFSSIGIAMVGFLVWGHHMFVSGQSETMGLLFSILTLMVAIPSAIKVFNWLATMYKGKILLATPMLYAIGFLWLFAIGGLTGIFLGTPASDVPLHDTYFVVAHFHFVMVGGAIFSMLGGLHYWWPKMFGRMYSEKIAKPTFWLLFFGFNLTFLPQFLLGLRGMPRRYEDYSAPAGDDAVVAAVSKHAEQYNFEGLHHLSTMGSGILLVGFTIVLIYFLWAVWRGKVAPANPWGASTLEWQATSPPDHHNFDRTMYVDAGPYDAYSDVKPGH